ncbi:uncharacterized protein LOC131567571 [Ammospiza caudacuta]|uniref:uncharacterized protein LOC131567571 n=1 Tax=Ammospiza caudacuta TaxID=2857398 RepID=UPI0027399CF6|nr:uncharacterized protein LOC131567571 [Ammospiza caudacuta]
MGTAFPELSPALSQPAGPGQSERSRCRYRGSRSSAGAGARGIKAVPVPVAEPGQSERCRYRGIGAVPVPVAEPGQSGRGAGPAAVRERCRRSVPCGAGSSPPQPREQEPARPRRPGQEPRSESTNTQTHKQRSPPRSPVQLPPAAPPETPAPAPCGFQPLRVVDLAAAPPPIPAPCCRIFSQTFWKHQAGWRHLGEWDSASQMAQQEHQIRAPMEGRDVLEGSISSGHLSLSQGSTPEALEG